MNDQHINQLLKYGLNHHLFQEEDLDYVEERILSVLGVNQFKRDMIEEGPIVDILNDLSQQDNFKKCLLMDCLLGRPSDIYRIYRTNYKQSPQRATQYFYQLSLGSFNVYPKWQESLEVENIDKDGFAYLKLNKKAYKDGFKPTINKRLIPISFNNEKKGWLLSYVYSPWVKEEAMIYRLQEKVLKNNQAYYNEMLNFLNKFPHYFIGPNLRDQAFAGSYRIGNDIWPIEQASIKAYYKSKRVKVEILNWPLSVFRLIGNNENRLLDKLFNLERAALSLDKDLVLYPIMRLDGSQFNVYVFFIRKDDLDKVDLLNMVGYQCINLDVLQIKDLEYGPSLKALDAFGDDDNEFISFVRNAI